HLTQIPIRCHFSTRIATAVIHQTLPPPPPLQRNLPINSHNRKSGKHFLLMELCPNALVTDCHVSSEKCAKKVQRKAANSTVAPKPRWAHLATPKVDATFSSGL